MTPVIGPELYADLVDVASQPGFRDWLGQVRATGGCAEPDPPVGRIPNHPRRHRRAALAASTGTAAGRLREPPTDPLPVLLGDLPGRHLPTDQGRAGRRQERP